MSYKCGEIYADIVQRSPEWFDIKRGKISASGVADAMMGKTTAGYNNMLAGLICERISGVTESMHPNKAMQWGIDHEDDACTVYEFKTGFDVQHVGFVGHPEIEYAGMSPDGMVGEDGLVEIKCPNSLTHISTLHSGEAPKKYMKQMQWQMACSGRLWCDFVSYDPRIGPRLQLFIKRVNRDDKLIADMEKAAKEMLAEVEKGITKLLSIT